MSTDITFAGVALSSVVPEAIVRKVSRQLLGESRDVFETVPGRAGAWVFPEEPGQRTIVVELELIGEADIDTTAYDARRDAVRRLAQWCAHRNLESLVIDDEDDRHWLAKLASAPTPDEWLEDASIALEFTALPYAFADELSTVSLSLTDSTPDTFDVDDEVDAYPVIEIEATEDIPSGIILTVNGVQLAYGDPLGTGDVITVSSLSFTVALGANTDTNLDGVFVPDDLSMLNVEGDFPILTNGSNSIEVDGGDCDVTVTWRRRFR